MKLNDPLITIPAKFGAFGAIMVVVMFLVFYLSGSNPLMEMGMFDFFIIPIFLFFGIKEYKDNYNHRLLEFWQGMTAGFVVYFTLACLTSIFIFAFLNLSDPSIMENYTADRLSILEEKKEAIIKEMGEATFIESQKEVQNITIGDLIFDNFLKKTFVGLLLTIMIAVIMKKKPPVESKGKT
ncbi:DUF4199 domain-containing protein [Reichenbachiella sp. MALMAid0571]|uniref:DUF4199 domain-containing protein n=1 Tax=Reichenbachiella sp. MALMAid0571 TaxID=3143939 RepID=UPI0032DE5080